MPLKYLIISKGIVDLSVCTQAVIINLKTVFEECLSSFSEYDEQLRG